MTIPQLLKMDIDKLEAMNNEELNAYCLPYLRPVINVKPEVSSEIDLEATGKPRKPRKKKEDNDLLKQAKSLAASIGVDFTALSKLKP